MDVEIFPRVPAFYSYSYVLRSEIAGLYDNFKVNYLKNYHTFFHCGCGVLHFHQQYKSFSLIASLTMLVIYWWLLRIILLVRSGILAYFCLVFP